MFTNTAILGLGDPKFGAAGWQLYWPAWGFIFAPAALCAAGLLIWLGKTLTWSIVLFALFLAVILASVEVCFLVT